MYKSYQHIINNRNAVVRRHDQNFRRHQESIKEIIFKLPLDCPIQLFNVA